RGGPPKTPAPPPARHPPPPLAHRLGIDLEPLRRRLDRPTLLDNTRDHPTPPYRGQRRVRVLPSSVGHEPSLRDVRRGTHTASLGGLISSVDHPHHPTKDNVPGHHS